MYIQDVSHWCPGCGDGTCGDAECIWGGLCGCCWERPPNPVPLWKSALGAGNGEANVGAVNANELGLASLG
jgi:hypothetical protein